MYEQCAFMYLHFQKYGSKVLWYGIELLQTKFVCTSILIVVVGGTHYIVARSSAVADSIFSHC